MTGPLFPIWQVDEREYEAICAYLDLPMQPQLHARLNDYLKHAPFTQPRPRGFALFLALPRLTAFRLARLDLTSKLLFPQHPVRHILNAVLALHECDGESYRRMAAAPTGWALWSALLRWVGSWVLSAMATLAWLPVQGLRYLSTRPFGAGADLAGKRILITGVNRGLGSDLLMHALERGAQVVGTVRTRDALEARRSELPPEAPVVWVAADLSEPGSLVQALRDADVSPASIGIAVLCAGIKHAGASVLSPTHLRETFEVNLFSGVELAEWLGDSAHPVTLVLVSSMGRWHGMHASGGYNASKAALSIWGESLEMELQAAGRGENRVMVVEPGMFESGMVEGTGIRRLLVAPRVALAARILSGAAAGRKTLRYPFWFALLTWAVCLGGRSLRSRIFARAVR